MIPMNARSSFNESQGEENYSLQNYLHITYLSQDEDQRAEACEQYFREIEEYLESHQIDPDYLKHLLYTQNKVKVMIYQNPYKDVIEKAIAFYKKISNDPPSENRISKFFLNEQIPQRIDDEDYYIKENISEEENILLMGDIFNFNYGKVPNLEKILHWFPDYLIKYFKTQQLLMIKEGPLPFDWRYYIAIMAVSAYGCNYLLQRLQLQFQHAGGNITWIEQGLKAVPQKIQNLAKLNSILAYQPWIIYENSKREEYDFKQLFKGNDKWSIQELIQAVTILAFHHGQACFSVSMGLIEEIDLPKEDIDIQTKFKQEQQNIDLIKKLISQQQPNKNKEILKALNELNSTDKKDLKNNVNPEKIVKKATGCFAQEEEKEKYINVKDYIIQKHMEDSDNKIFDFSFKNYSVLHNTDYNWPNHGFAIMNEYFSELAYSLTDQFEYIQKMSKLTFGKHENINTEIFRRCVSNYVQNLLGYTYDDFIYQLVNLLLPQNYKFLIKKIATQPFKIDILEFYDPDFVLDTAEICHSAMLVCDSKFQVELLYFLQYLQSEILSEI